MTGNVSTQNLTTLYGSTGTVTPVQSTVGNVTTGSQNLTTLYPGNYNILPSSGYGNANVVALLAAGTDGANTIGNIVATGNVTADYFIGTFQGNIIGNLSVPGANTDVLFNNAGNAGASNNFTFNTATNLLTVSGQASVSGNVTAGNVIALGNVAGTYILGNGSQLTGLPATYSNAQVAAYLESGTLTSNIITTGNITGGYLFGNGSQLTGLPASYSNANVTSLLASFGSNSISTSGNITAGLFTGNGAGLSAIVGANVTGTVANATYAMSAGSADTAGLAQFVSGNAQGNITSLGTLTGISATGNISTTGNITGDYFLGNGSQLTGLPNTAPGGSNTQIQFNNNGVFDGNTAVTFDTATGNFTVGNIVTIGSVINSKNAWSYTPANALLSVNNARIVVGNGWNGNSAVQYDHNNIMRGSRFTVIDKQTFDYTANSLQPGSRYVSGLLFADLATSNIPAVSTSRLIAASFVLNIGNGNSAMTNLNNIAGGQNSVLVGNSSSPTFSNLGNIGNAVVNFATGQSGLVSVYNGSTANTATGVVSQVLVASTGGNIGNSVGFSYSRPDAANSLSTWNVGYFHPDNIALFGVSQSGNARLSTNYYAFYNKDNYADVQLGSLRSFHYFTANVLPTTGSITVSKANGQYQTTTGNLTGNLTISGFSNFATSNTVTAGSNTGTKLSSDVVTVLIPQGATPYSISLPTGNSSIYYVNGVSSVAGTANSLVQITITGSNVAGTTQYLVNIDDSGGTLATYGNAQVASFLANFGANTISTTGNITAGNLLTSGVLSATSGISTADGINATGNISTTGNVIGSYLWGDGSNITGVVAGAHSVQFDVKNTSGGTLVKGTPVYVTGTVGATTVLEVAASRADTAATMPAIGVLTATLINNATGQAISVGDLTTVDTSLYTVGQELYVSATGGITGTRPQDNYQIQKIGSVGRVNASTGSIQVNIWNIEDLPNLGSGNIWIGNVSNTAVQTTLATYTGNIGAGTVSVSGNVTGAYFIGNGSQLTGLPASYSNANVAAFLASYGSNTISSTGNITTTANIAGGYILGNGSQLTGIVSSYGNANVTNLLANFGSNTISTTGNITGGNFNTSGLVSVSGNVVSTANINGVNLNASSNVFAANVYTTGTVSSAGTISSVGNITSSANVNANNVQAGIVQASTVSSTGNIIGTTLSVTGNTNLNILNVSGNSYLAETDVGGNLSVAGGIFALGSEIQAGSLTTTGNIVAANTANISGGNVIANANVVAGNIRSLGIISATGNISTTANISGGNLLTTGQISSSGNITAGNINTAGIISATGSLTSSGVSTGALTATSVSSSGNVLAAAVSASGNITGAYFIGNGSQLTGLPAVYSNANVVSLLAAFGSNTISTTGNVNTGVLTATSVNTAGAVSATGNVTGGNINTGGIVSATGNITSSGSLITTGVAGNIAGVNYYFGNFFSGNGSLLSGIAGANVTGTVANATYAVSAGSATTATTVTGNAQANITSLGTLTGVSATGNISTTGNITGNYILGNGSQLTGLPATYGNANVAANLAAFGSNPISTTGNVTAGYFIGNGSLLTSITGGNVTGTVANATYATTAGTATSATTAGTVTGNAQANITSLGTLTSLTSSGNISTTGNVSGAYFLGNGSQLTGIVSSYGNANVTTLLASLGSNTISSTGNITTTANISGNYFIGNGSLLTGIAGGGGGSNIALGTSNVTVVSSGGNVSVGVGGTGNVAVFATTGVTVTGTTASTNFQETTYSFGNATGTITPDIANGSIQTLTLTGNITLNTINSISNGQSATFIMQQDSTGNRLLTSTWKFASNVRTLSTSANAIDIISVFYSGNTYYASLSRGYA